MTAPGASGAVFPSRMTDMPDAADIVPRAASCGMVRSCACAAAAAVDNASAATQRRAAAGERGNVTKFTNLNGCRDDNPVSGEGGTRTLDLGIMSAAL